MRLADRYQLRRRIASGGMGSVHEGVDERLERRVAVKVLKEEYADDRGSWSGRPRGESRGVAGPPNIAQVFDSGRQEGLHFIVMEFVEGDHLGRLLREQGRLSPRMPWTWRHRCAPRWLPRTLPGSSTATSSQATSWSGPTACSRSPISGSLRSRTGAADRLGGGAGHGGLSVAGTGVRPGRGSRLDLYSVGVLLFEMLTGSVPFTDDAPVAVALSYIRDEVLPVATSPPRCPRAWPRWSPRRQPRIRGTGTPTPRRWRQRCAPPSLGPARSHPPRCCPRSPRPGATRGRDPLPETSCWPPRVSCSLPRWHSGRGHSSAAHRPGPLMEAPPGNSPRHRGLGCHRSPHRPRRRAPIAPRKGRACRTTPWTATSRHSKTGSRPGATTAEGRRCLRKPQGRGCRDHPRARRTPGRRTNRRPDRQQGRAPQGAEQLRRP